MRPGIKQGEAGHKAKYGLSKARLELVSIAQLGLANAWLISSEVSSEVGAWLLKNYHF